MTQRHKVFVSYHHQNDQLYRNKFDQLFSRYYDITVSRSVEFGDIDPNNNVDTIRRQIRDEYISDATVIVVLVGRQTWQRKHVDWEIYSGLRDTKLNPRCGLLGLVLPTYPSYKDNKYYFDTIPPRLYDNLDCGFATIHPWLEDPRYMQNWIHAAFKRREKAQPNLSRPMFARNRTGPRWYD